ncbi:hypothetical protein AAP_04061 [Ascosphaera apis ARSEF 7405]|uniref:Uncharacterized protein n=1 Tax=Ascosphaera apis ARSEF 7405 TaxID=392613 RepID=A0A167XI14_9EURO|nr:hypothetical protein AAP_04061 [Ascosphaera apis ARSEF 7405]
MEEDQLTVLFRHQEALYRHHDTTTRLMSGDGYGLPLGEVMGMKKHHQMRRCNRFPDMDESLENQHQSCIATNTLA